jgi:hypothetical protein
MSLNPSPIGEVCQEIANLSDPLPEAILSILYNETRAGDDMLALKLDETYRGGARCLRRLIENRKRLRRRGRDHEGNVPSSY